MDLELLCNLKVHETYSHNILHNIDIIINLSQFGITFAYSFIVTPNESRTNHAIIQSILIGY